MGWAATAAPPRGTRREQRRRGSPPDRTVRRSWLELLEEGGQGLDGPPEGGDEPLRRDRRRGREGEDGVGAPHLQPLQPDRLGAQAEEDDVEEPFGGLGKGTEAIPQLAASVLDLPHRAHPGEPL